jgi:hypothetical protein
MDKKEAKRNLPHFDLFPKNQKGQGLSTSTIILLILGVIILVILVLGFVLGWDKIAPFIKQENNIDTVTQTCNTACTMERRYDFCQNNNVALTINKDKYIATCYTYASAYQFKDYNIELCSNLDCKPVVTCKDWTFKKGTEVIPVEINGKSVITEPNLAYCS